MTIPSSLSILPGRLALPDITGHSVPERAATSPAETDKQQNDHGERVTLSPEGRAACRQEAGSGRKPSTASEPAPRHDAGAAPAEDPQATEQLRELKARDREVRTHEQAHAAAGGRYAAAPHYQYQLGPDARHYAVDGEVSIDISAVPGEPQQTVHKMEVVIKAALAPAEPSGQDRQVAASARATAAEARAELARQAADRQDTELSAQHSAQPEPRQTATAEDHRQAAADKPSRRERPSAVEQAAQVIVNRYRIGAAGQSASSPIGLTA